MDKSRNDFTKNAISIIEAIQIKSLDPYSLKRNQRLQVVVFLRNEGKTQFEIARFLGVCDKTIWLDCREIKRNAAQLVDEISLKQVAGDLIREAEVLVTKAKKKEDYKLAWQIKCELIDKLQSLGFIYKAPDKLEHEGKSFRQIIVVGGKEEDELGEKLREVAEIAKAEDQG